jgi:hypothetical protein
VTGQQATLSGTCRAARVWRCVAFHPLRVFAQSRRSADQDIDLKDTEMVMLVSFICVCAECVVLRCASDWAAAQCLPACGRVCTSCLGCVSSTPHRTVTLVRVACTSVGTISAPMANNTFASGRTRALRMNELPTKRGGIGGGGAFFLSCMHVVVVAYAEPSFVAIRTVSTVALWRGDVCVCRRQSLGARLSRCRSSASLAQRTGMSSDLHVCTCVLVHLGASSPALSSVVHKLLSHDRTHALHYPLYFDSSCVWFVLGQP